jgi:hypothetical protein
MKPTSEGVPESQRMTIPNPMPVASVADSLAREMRTRSVGSYVIINEAALERRRHSIQPLSPSILRRS